MSIEQDARTEAEKRYPPLRTPGGYHEPQWVALDAFMAGYIAGASRPVTDAEVRAVAPFVYELLRTDQPVTQRDVDSAVRAALEAAREVEA